MLQIPIGQKLSIEGILLLNANTAAIYSPLSKRTLMRDIDELLSLGLLVYDDGTYYAHADLLKKNISRRKKRKKNVHNTKNKLPEDDSL